MHIIASCVHGWSGGCPRSALSPSHAGEDHPFEMRQAQQNALHRESQQSWEDCASAEVHQRVENAVKRVAGQLFVLLLNAVKVLKGMRWIDTGRDSNSCCGLCRYNPHCCLQKCYNYNIIPVHRSGSLPHASRKAGTKRESHVHVMTASFS